MKYKQKYSINVNEGVIPDFSNGSGTNIVLFDLRLCLELILSLIIVRQ